ncbi:carbohydrate sulfotransferase 15-like isoform X1 [Haliotis rufescens]|uniref:carbohydrate sulfotransferase 15-like isoform X1 n=1 Tax=Haliotis rufescens TaxID=6454 RepID=UPI00201E8960|nr:carbohydrate sulfotransferase 15-like isoform X1 [Haliotis rufescens]
MKFKIRKMVKYLGVVLFVSCIGIIVFLYEPEEPRVPHRQHMLELFKHMQNRSRNSSHLWGYRPEEVTFQRTVWYLAHARYNVTLWRDLDLMKLQVPRPLLEFTSHCWWVHNVTPNHCPWAMEPSRGPMAEMGETGVLRCLPSFYIIGQGESGTTDLFNKLTRHPHVAPHTMTETEWLSRTRLIESCSSFETHLNLLQISANFIQRNYKQSVDPYITGDATPGYFSYNDFWDMLPGNEGCTEPCVTNADIIHHLNPGAKIILSLRNPTDRLYSYYISKSAKLGRVASQQDFHDLVNREIVSFVDCLASQSLRGCCYNYTIADSLTEEIDLRRGIYHVFLWDWRKVFPSKQIHVHTFEDYTSNKAKHLAEIFKFLDLNALFDSNLHRIAAANQEQTDQTIGDMMPWTRFILDRFYKPHNQKLAALMGKDYW